MRFNNFFVEYTLRLKEIDDKAGMPEFLKVFLKILKVMGCVYGVLLIFFLLVLQNVVWVLIVIVAILLLIMWVVLKCYEFINRSKLLNEYRKPYSRDRMKMLINLLKDYGIKLNSSDSFDKVDLLIKQAEEDKIKYRPFLFLYKFLQVFTSITIPVVAWVATKIAEGLTIENLIVIVFIYVVLVAMFLLCAFSIKSFIIEVIYPDYNKYEELIYDLKQLKIFYCNSNVTEIL